MASLHDDLGLYALGALDDPGSFEAHLETCEACRTELAGLRRSLAVADVHLGRTVPPRGLRERTLAAVRSAPATPPPERSARVISLSAVRRSLSGVRTQRWAGIVAVAAIVMVVAGIGLRSLTSDDFSADRVIALAAPEGGPARGEARIDDTATGQIIALAVSGLPDAPAGSYYECWWVGPNDSFEVQDRVSAGTFKGGNGTYRMQSSADPARFQKMGVTLEPDDGNPQRTGDKVLASQPLPSAATPSATTPPAAPVAPAASAPAS